MKKIIRTDSDNSDFIMLINLLDVELTGRYPEEQFFFAQFNKLNTIKHVIMVYINNEAAGCGALRKYSPDTAEVKRMFVKNEFRRQGIAQIILQEIELWAKELNFSFLMLETGKAQPEAINLYLKNGFQLIPNYGEYSNVNIVYV